MKEIYNAGRVVGLSSYEMYVRHFLQNFPDDTPMTEKEWLAATLGNGASMILKVSKGTKSGVHDYKLPDNSNLCGAQTITASMFDGECKMLGNWATCITSYGSLILNTSAKHPTTPGDSATSVPYTNVDTSLEGKTQKYTEYLKIVDGVAYHPGKWTETNTAPRADLEPDLTQPSVIRLRITEDLTEDVYVLLTGFLYNDIITGITKTETGSTNTEHPENGDFLGCSVFPWASKIIFTVPSETLSVLTRNAYSRKLPSTYTEKAVKSKAIIDFESNPVDSYYTANADKQDSQIEQDITQLNILEDNAAILAAYQRNDKTAGGLKGTDFPPVLFGGSATTTGKMNLSPLDIAAPGTVKMFEEKDLAINYPKVIPNVFGMFKNDDGDLYVTDATTASADMVPITTKVKVVNKGTTSDPQYITSTKARADKTGKPKEASIFGVSLQDTAGADLNTAGSNSISRTDKTTTDSDQTSWVDATTGLSWAKLLNALGLNKKVEILGTKLRNFRGNLPNIVSGDNGLLNIKGTGKSTIAGTLDINDGVTISKYTPTVNGNTATSEAKFNTPIKSGTNYITFSNGLRLYIAKTAPTGDIPVGSIGIGWGMDN